MSSTIATEDHAISAGRVDRADETPILEVGPVLVEHRFYAQGGNAVYGPGHREMTVSEIYLADSTGMPADHRGEFVRVA